MKLKATKSVTDFSVEILDNGFKISFSGRNDKDDYTDDRLLCKGFEELYAIIDQITNLPE